MKYQAELGTRIKSSRFRDIIPARGSKLWWLQYEDGSGEWLNATEQETIWENGYLKSTYKGKSIRYLSSSGPRTRSLRAFRRRLKEYSKYLPKGTEFILMSRYIGYDITAKIK